MSNKLIKKCEIKKVVSVLPNDYNILENKPNLNGITLEGDLDITDFNLLSKLSSKYPSADVGELVDESSYLVVLKESTPVKISLKELVDFASENDTDTKIILEDDGDISIELLPNIFYEFIGDFDTLTITFAETMRNSESEFKGQFVVGESVPIVIFPESVLWVGLDEIELEQNKTYQFSVLNNVGVIVGV